MVDVKNAKLLLIQSQSPQTHQNIMITDDCQIGDLVSRNKSCKFNLTHYESVQSKIPIFVYFLHAGLICAKVWNFPVVISGCRI